LRYDSYVRRRGAYLLVLGTLAAGAACGGLIGVDGLTADRDPAADAGPPDGPSADGPSPDGGAGDANGRDAGSVCAAPHDLCDDFDTAPVGDPSRWTELKTGGGGLLRLATDTFVSPPASLWATYPAVDGGDTSPIARLSKDFPGSVTGATCAFDVRIEAVDSQLIVWTFGIKPAASTGIDGWWIEWAVEGSQSRVSAIGQSNSAGSWDEHGDYFGLPPLRTWVKVGVDVTRTSVLVTFDGNAVFSLQITMPPNTGAGFEFGAWTRDVVNSANDVHLDDVVCDLRR
jgi:hypothetical protein